MTIVTKIIIKYIWDCKVHSFLPNVESCPDNIREKINILFGINSSLSKVITNSGLPFFARENFVNNDFP
jgi:hypothetical protein